MKIGRDKFLLWWFPIEKEYLVYVSDLVSGLPEVFTLNMILEWSDLAGCSLSNGNVAALKPASGVTTQVALTKIILNIVFLVLGHNSQTWLLASTESVRSSPVLARKTPARDENSTTRTPAPAPGALAASFTAPDVQRQTSSPAPSGHQHVTHAAPPSPAMSPIIRKRRPIQPNVVGIVVGQQENVARSSSKRTFQKPTAKKTLTTSTRRYANLVNLVKTNQFCPNSFPLKQAYTLYPPRIRTPIQPFTVARARERVATAKRARKELSLGLQEKVRGLTVAEEDDVEMALGISVSEQVQSKGCLLWKRNWFIFRFFKRRE